MKLKNYGRLLIKRQRCLLNLILTTFIFSSLFYSKAYGAQITSAQKVIVLVPGFFNSFAPEYFSDDIVNSFKNNNFKVYVAEGLDPIGSIETNGKIVLKILNSIKNQNPQSQIIVVGHSAGGLYTLEAISKGATYIKSLFTVSTPFNGVEFVQDWQNRSSLFNDLMQFCVLDGLRQLTPPLVKEFFKKLRVPADLKIYAFGGYQPTNINFTDAANKTAVLSVTDQFITGPSDGIVGFDSATMNPQVLSTQNKPVYFSIDRKFYFTLEHWEQVLDYRHFVLLGVINIGLVQDRQIQQFGALAHFIQQQTP